MKLEINHMKRNEKKTYYMQTKQHATKKKNGSMKEIKKYLETNNNKATTSQNHGTPQKQCSEGSS